jgi:uncharacterized damage-inducible protein DinB
MQDDAGVLSTELRQMLDHMGWADALIWSEVLDLPAAVDDERTRCLLHHVHLVHWAYLQLWRGERVDLRELAEFPDLPAVLRWGRAYYAALPGFIGTLEPADLERPIAFPWATELAEHYGEIHPTSVRQSLVQIPMHSAYHRGQVNTRIRELGGEPPLTDFVAWTWAGRPAAVWPGE